VIGSTAVAFARTRPAARVAGRGLLGLSLVLGTACSKSESHERASQQRTATSVEPAQACGTIAFASSEGEGRERVSLVAASGGEIRSLALPGPSSFPAAVSPDGRTLLLLSSEPLAEGKTRDRFALVELDSSGEVIGEPRPIGSEGAALRNPAWSPDGSWLVFESDANSFRDLYRLDLGAASALRLTNDVQGNFEPAVSPDGQSIAFVSSRDGNAELYSMTADGGAPQRLTDSRGDDSQPMWSPDARTIAFTSGRDPARGHDAFMLEVATGSVTPVVRDGSRKQPALVRDLVFSPAGDRIAFTELVSARGTAAIVIVDVGTGDVLTRSDAVPVDGQQAHVDEQPSWSPDGEWLVFARSHAGQSDIVRMRADGSTLERLTAGDGVHWLPRWIGGPACPRAALQIAPTEGRG
jgi:TolB protein